MEKARVLKDSQNYVINVVYLDGQTKLDYQVHYFLDVYELKNGHKRSIFHLGHYDTNVSAYGDQRWWIAPEIVEKNKIDISKIYVDYKTKESSGLISGAIVYNANISTAVSSNTSAINIIGNQIDLNTKVIKQPLNWIRPTLSNQWLPFNLESEHTAEYCKETNGYVNFRGTIRGGLQGELFKLPVGYRPLKNETFCISSNYRFAEIVVFIDGSVQVRNGSNEFISLSAIRFNTER